MITPEDREQELRRKELEIQAREQEIRLRELENKIYQEQREAREIEELSNAANNLRHNRIFEISALQALRRRLKNPDDDFKNTGFAKFTATLDKLLTQERASVELRQAKIIAKQLWDRLSEHIARQIP